MNGLARRFIKHKEYEKMGLWTLRLIPGVLTSLSLTCHFIDLYPPLEILLLFRTSSIGQSLKTSNHFSFTGLLRL